MTLLLDRPDARVFHSDWRGLLDALPRRDDGTVCDSIIVDCPYSERTHAGHDGGAVSANLRDTGRGRREISYPFWSPDDVAEFVEAWDGATRGWFVTITDDVLAVHWRAALESSGRKQRAKRLPSGRYSFAPLPFVARGGGVRLTGDGPSSWTCWIVVSRPRTTEFVRWGTLPGAYLLPPGHSEHKAVVGGKPLWLMRALVRDYTRPNDLVCDPCCGAGTTLLAAVMEGRRAVGGDVLRDHAEMSARRLDGMVQQPLFGGLA